MKKFYISEQINGIEDGYLPGCEAVNSSETSIKIYQITLSYITEDSHLHIRRRENLKSHQVNRILSNRFCQNAPTVHLRGT
jgi:hypothetical protein